MSNKLYRILLIEDDEDYAMLIKTFLDGVKRVNYDLVVHERLSGGLDYLTNHEADLVLLDLSLPDSSGYNTFEQLNHLFPDTPIVILTGHDDESLGTNAVQDGAQDYLVKGQIDRNLLERAIRYAIERHAMLAKFQEMMRVDELTGLYNRRGMMSLANQQIGFADRLRKRVFVLYIDLNNLKTINDTYGHLVGDQALVDTADLLKNTFRKSDIVARIGGDEFVVFGLDINEGSGNTTEIIINRLKNAIAMYNLRSNKKFDLSLSYGVTYYDPQNPLSIDDLLSEADKLMYEHKMSMRVKKSS